MFVFDALYHFIIFVDIFYVFFINLVNFYFFFIFYHFEILVNVIFLIIQFVNMNN